MNKKLILLILAGTSLLVACNNENTTTVISDSPAVSKADAVAVVNGQYISKASLTAMEDEISQRARGQTFPKEKLLEEKDLEVIEGMKIETATNKFVY